MKVVHTIRDTPMNSNGLCALAADSDNCYLAYPGSATSGELQIFDAVNLNAKTMIPAHDSPLAAMAFSLNGAEIATASEKGTVIRVFSVNDGTKLYEFRRGVKRCVSISSLIFSTCKQYLCCSSNTETVHIFKLEQNATTLNERTSASNQNAVGQRSNDDNWMGYLKSTVANYLPLPSQVTDVFTQGRAFASAMLSISGIKHSCAITTIQKSLRYNSNFIKVIFLKNNNNHL
jgi:autophagy-related protein 18